LQLADALFAAGDLVIAGRDSGFQRLYDLPERVLPRPVLDARPLPKALRELVVRAVRAREALAEYAIGEHGAVAGTSHDPTPSPRRKPEKFAICGRDSGLERRPGPPAGKEDTRAPRRCFLDFAERR